MKRGYRRLKPRTMEVHDSPGGFGGRLSFYVSGVELISISVNISNLSRRWRQNGRHVASQFVGPLTMSTFPNQFGGWGILPFLWSWQMDGHRFLSAETRNLFEKSEAEHFPPEERRSPGRMWNNNARNRCVRRGLGGCHGVEASKIRTRLGREIQFRGGLDDPDTVRNTKQDSTRRDPKRCGPLSLSHFDRLRAFRLLSGLFQQPNHTRT